VSCRIAMRRSGAAVDRRRPKSQNAFLGADRFGLRQGHSP
jgi:hypothetical protein